MLNEVRKVLEVNNIGWGNFKCFKVHDYCHKKTFKSQICRIISNLSLLELDLFYHYLFYDKLPVLFVTIVTTNSFSATFLIYIKTHQMHYLRPMTWTTKEMWNSLQIALSYIFILSSWVTPIHEWGTQNRSYWPLLIKCCKPC